MQSTAAKHGMQFLSDLVLRKKKSNSVLMDAEPVRFLKYSVLPNPLTHIAHHALKGICVKLWIWISKSDGLSSVAFIRAARASFDKSGADNSKSGPYS